MGTRSLIKVEGETIAIYKHWDGNPEHMLPWLKEFNSRFAKERGSDGSYKLAQLLRFTSKYGEKYHLDSSEFTGYGIVNASDDCGQEYTYTLLDNGKVTVNE